MNFDDLPEETQHNVLARLFRMEIEADEDNRRMFTTFGYNRGSMPAFFMWLFLPFVVAVFTIIGLAIFYVPRHPDTSMATSAWFWWIILPPFALVPVTTFLFFKLRYAVRALGIIIVVGVVLLLVESLFNWIMGTVI